MEPVTHLLTGACLARTGFNRKTALATAAMALAAEAPDIDIVAYLTGDSVTGFHHHRGYTHTFIGTPFIALLVVGILYAFYLWRKKAGKWKKEPPRWGLLFVFSWIAAMSHILLDFTNNYGVRPWMPVSYRWYSWDIVFIFEPLLWVALIGALVLPSLFGLVDSEVGVRSKTPRGRVAAVFALVFMVSLWGYRDYQHRRAVAALKSLTYEGAEPIRVSAFPKYINPFAWSGVVETATFFQTIEVNSLSGEVDPRGTARIYYKPEETPVTLAAKSSRLGRVYLDWAQYPIVEAEQLEPPNGGYIVRFRDLRFVSSEMSRRRVLAAYVQLDQRLDVVEQGFDPRTRGGDVHGAVH